MECTNITRQVLNPYQFQNSATTSTLVRPRFMRGEKYRYPPKEEVEKKPARRIQPEKVEPEEPPAKKTKKTKAVPTT